MFPYFFSEVYTRRCWICGSDEQLSREHKIKASLIRRHFAPEPLVIGSDDGVGDLRLVRGPKSDELKFAASICTTCNNDVTSEADRAHDRLMSFLQRNVTDQESITRILDAPGMRAPAKEFIENNRYFAKLLGCHLAQDEYPVPKRLSNFVSGRSSFIPIRASIKLDPRYLRLSSLLPDEKLEYAAHGGLIINTSRKRDYNVTGFLTSISLEHVQVIIEYRLSKLELMEMQLRFPEFMEFCRKAGRAAAEDPTIEQRMRSMGYLGD